MRERCEEGKVSPTDCADWHRFLRLGDIGATPTGLGLRLRGIRVGCLRADRSCLPELLESREFAFPGFVLRLMRLLSRDWTKFWVPLAIPAKRVGSVWRLLEDFDS